MTTTQTTPASSGSPGIAKDANGNPVTNPSTQLDENSFLKLLVAQLQYQDPLKPTDSQAFVQEQAQFSMVEGVLNVEKALKALTATTQLGQDVDMIGKTVTYTQADGSTAAGVVGGVTSVNGVITLTVGGANVDPATIVSISATSNSTAGAGA